MTAEDVKNVFESKIKSQNESIGNCYIELRRLEESVSKLTSEVQALKTQTSVKSKVVGSTTDTMTPFASRLNPTANGSNLRVMK